MKNTKKTMMVLLLTFVAACILCACSGAQGNGAAKAAESSAPTESAAAEPEQENEKIGISKTPTFAGVYDSDGKPVVDLYYENLTVSLPDGKSQERAQQMIDEAYNLRAKEETDRFRQYYQEDGDTKRYYEQVLLNSRADEEVVSLLMRLTVSAGGAHSNYGYSALTLSPQTGEQLTLEDVGVDEEKTKDCIIELMEGYNQTDSYRFHPERDNDDMEELLSNFFLSNNGMVVFAVNPYRFGLPFSAGAFRIEIPYADLGVKEEYLPREQASPERSCIMDWYGNRFYGDGTQEEGAGEMIEQLHEEHSITLHYDLTGIVLDEQE